MAAAQVWEGSVGSPGGRIDCGRAGSFDEPAGDVCPRCGCGFHCGAADAAPCVCTTLTLGAPLLARLRRDYSTCLCIACLSELAAADMAAAAASDTMPAPAIPAPTERPA